MKHNQEVNNSHRRQERFTLEVKKDLPVYTHIVLLLYCPLAYRRPELLEKAP
jgi:hypothetical protein